MAKWQATSGRPMKRLLYLIFNSIVWWTFISYILDYILFSILDDLIYIYIIFFFSSLFCEIIQSFCEQLLSGNRKLTKSAKTNVP